MPVDNSMEAEAAQRAGFVKKYNFVGNGQGTVVRIVEWVPGHAIFPHRTQTMDYSIVLSGEIDVEFDSGQVVTMKQGGRRDHPPLLVHSSGEPEHRARRRAQGHGARQQRGSDRPSWRTRRRSRLTSGHLRPAGARLYPRNIPGSHPTCRLLRPSNEVRSAEIAVRCGSAHGAISS
jgi:hypothetical protein